MNKVNLKVKQTSVLNTMTKLMDYELTELEINALIAIQGLIIERILKEKKK
jgi:hypothetical protein